MKNYLLIVVTQKWPSIMVNWPQFLKRSIQSEHISIEKAEEDIDYFETEAPKSKRALLTLSPHAWILAKDQHPNIKMFNYVGLTYALVKALNDNGYLVDVVDHRCGKAPKRRYDLLVAHGSKCRDILDELPTKVPIFQYVSGVYWESFNRESEERYTRFYDKYHGVQPTAYLRSMNDLIAGEEYLTKRANTLFTINCPRMIASYGEYSRKFHYTGLGAYIDPLFEEGCNGNDFDLGRKNFIYVGGTGGNLQKGLDLLIEAFAQTPSLNLYIYCKVEDEIMRYCKKHLAAANIHYIYHWRFMPFHRNLKKLLGQVNFSVHAPINIGMGTAFMATMGVGMIPVGYLDLVDSGEGAVLTDSWQVGSLVACIKLASEKSPEWCQTASQLTIENYDKFCDPNQVTKNFTEMFAQCS